MQLPIHPSSIRATREDAGGGAARDAGSGEPEGASEPREVVRWALKRFAERRLIVTTGFGLEGCVMIDMLWREQRDITVYYLDTHFLFAQTHALRERLAGCYAGLKLVNAGTSLTEKEQAERYGGALWKTNPDKCCELRKVRPMEELLRGADAWMTAIRRTQGATRAGVKTVEWDGQHEVVKISPLAHWSREETAGYAMANGVPYNELHDRGYPSIGCTHCTEAVAGATLTDYTRAGRWAGTKKTECGLHWNAAGDGI